jgi:2,3-diketo-5-methylthio-1-phosphopentane phosphatase
LRSHHPPSNPIPPPARCQVWIDFDGTITGADVLDELIRRHAVDDSWLAVEAEWQQGLIGSRECLSRQLAAVRATDAELDALLADIPLDPGVNRLFALLAEASVPATVVSDGIARFISNLMNRAGLSHVPVRSNRIERRGTAMKLQCPHGSADCVSAAAHCKCHSMVALSTHGRDCNIYVGDGRSDLCPARRANIVFAKGVLAANLSGEGISYRPFETLDDVTEAMADTWDVRAEPRRLPVRVSRADRGSS